MASTATEALQSLDEEEAPKLKALSSIRIDFSRDCLTTCYLQIVLYCPFITRERGLKASQTWFLVPRPSSSLAKQPRPQLAVGFLKAPTSLES